MNVRRPVYSTEEGRRRLCPKCRWPAADCRCSGRQPADEPVPARIVAKLRLEKRPSGKSVTIVEGLPKNERFLMELAKDLKRACGAGGTAGEQSVQLQGDQREKLRDLLARRGWTVKG